MFKSHPENNFCLNRLSFSIIIPVLNEERQISLTLASLEAERSKRNFELVVVDGGSGDQSVEVIRQFESVLLVETATANRGLQMNAGARLTTGDVLIFLHADTRLPPCALAAIERALADERTSGGCFQIRFPPGSPYSLGVMERGINLRTRLFKTATGDQAIFVRRDVFTSIGGFQAIPLMEDIRLINEVKRSGQIAVLDEQVEISPRRWLKHGVWRTMFLMYALRFGYWIGISPATLKRFFIDVR